MQKAIDDKKYFFVDEAGDPVFFNTKGKNIVGTEGCSSILLLGFISTKQPEVLRSRLLALHSEVINDPFLKDVPSLSKTRIAFHAKDDVPEVREKVFKLIKELDFKYHCIVARKIEKTFISKYKKNEDTFYFDLVSKLFENDLHKSKENHIYYATRGNRLATHRFDEALNKARLVFTKKWGSTEETVTALYPQSPSGEPCLQIVDYINWAIQRAYQKRETRYVNFIQEKLSYIVDVLDTAKYPNNFYTSKNPFDIEKTSPLRLDL
jgi:hypothetical protein